LRKTYHFIGLWISGNALDLLWSLLQNWNVSQLQFSSISSEQRAWSRACFLSGINRPILLDRCRAIRVSFVVYFFFLLRCYVHYVVLVSIQCPLSFVQTHVSDYHLLSNKAISQICIVFGIGKNKNYLVGLSV